MATDGAVAAFGRDVRRLRPNILIGGVADMDEVTWPGAELHIGDLIVRIDSRRGALPDDDGRSRHSWIAIPACCSDIGRRFGGRLALNADVVRAGTIRVGDAVTLVREAVSGHRRRQPAPLKARHESAKTRRRIGS